LDWGQFEWYGPDGHIMGYSFSFESDGSYTYEMEISQNAANGTYYVGSLQAYDQAANRATFNSGADFTAEVTVGTT